MEIPSGISRTRSRALVNFEVSARDINQAMTTPITIAIHAARSMFLKLFAAA